MVQPIPAGYPRVSVSLAIDGAAAAIGFYTTHFGAVERMRMDGPDGKVSHSELELGDSLLMVADEYPDMGFVGPRRLGGSPVALHLYVDDVDATFAAAVGAGATVLREVEDQFYGDRSGQIEDPWGHRWSLATHVEDVPPDEMERRAAAAMSGQGSDGG